MKLSVIQGGRGQYDLPPRWDGRPVRWRGWTDARTTMVLHQTLEPCPQCGNTDEPMTNAGGTDYYAVGLYAFRCRSCGLDTVWDYTTNQWWELEGNDYGPDGSSAP